MRFQMATELGLSTRPFIKNDQFLGHIQGNRRTPIILNQRQGEIIRDLGSPQTTITPEMTQLAKALVQEIRQSGN